MYSSPKFINKIVYVSKLDEFDRLVDLSYLSIPHEVVTYEIVLPNSLFACHHHYYHDISHHRHHRHQNHHRYSHHHHHYQVLSQKTNRFKEHYFIFGRDFESLAELEEYNPSELETYIPSVIPKLVEHIQISGLEEEGIFRRNPSTTALSKARDKLDEYDDTSIIDKLDVHISASLLKMFLAGLPEPLMTSKFVFENYYADRGNVPFNILCKLRKYYRKKPHYYTLLNYLIAFLAKVADKSDKNKMSIRSLAIVFASSLVRSTVAFSDILTNPVEAAIYLQQVKRHMTFIEFLIMERESIFISNLMDVEEHVDVAENSCNSKQKKV
ncbi:MAG: Rho GTPase activation protein [Benjaminiella poitrasii]|nr:MAG: Rho GTPase activation protein [Benjaminiella poitrasii]